MIHWRGEGKTLNMKKRRALDIATVCLSLCMLMCGNAAENGGEPGGAGEAWRLERMLPQQNAILWDVDFAPDGKHIVAGCYDGTAPVWDVATGEKVHVLGRDEHPVEIVEYSPDGQRILTAGGPACLWDAATGRHLHTLQSDTNLHCHEAAISEDGTRVFTEETWAGYHSGPSWVYCWDMDTGGKLFLPVYFTPDWEGRIDDWASDSRFIVTEGEGERVNVWDQHARRPIGSIDCGDHRDMIGAGSPMCLSPDTALLVTVTGDELLVWEVQAGKLQSRFGKHIGDAALSPDGTLVATSAGDDAPHGHDLLLWDVRTGRRLCVLNGHTDGLRGIAWSPDGSRIATVGMDRRVIVWKQRVRPGAVVRQQAKPAQTSPSMAPAHLLGKIPPDETKVAAALAEGLGSHNADIRFAAAQEIVAREWRHVTNDTIPLLVGVLRDEDADTRRCAVESLGYLDPTPPGIVPHLVASLKDPVAGVRRAAAWALSQVARDDETAAGALMVATHDPESIVRVAATLALGYFDAQADDVIPRLIDLLDHQDPRTRERAARSLSWFKSKAGAGQAPRSIGRP